MPMIVLMLGGNLPAGAQCCSQQEGKRPAEMAAHLGQAKDVRVCVILLSLLTVISQASPFCT